MPALSISIPEKMLKMNLSVAYFNSECIQLCKNLATESVIQVVQSIYRLACQAGFILIVFCFNTPKEFFLS